MDWHPIQGESRNTGNPGHFMLQKPEISACLMDQFPHMQTLRAYMYLYDRLLGLLTDKASSFLRHCYWHIDVHVMFFSSDPMLCLMAGWQARDI